MPEFTKPLKEGVLTIEELISEIRFLIAAEHEAVQLYLNIARNSDNSLAKKVLEDIADEEKVHVGEFQKLLFILDPEEKKFYEEGEKEVEEIEKEN